MRLRMATLEDLPSIAELGKVMHLQSTFATMHYDTKRVIEIMSGLMKKNQFLLVAEGTNGDVIGGMAGMVIQSWFGDDMVANDLALFIHPNHRGGMLATRLVREFVRWATLAGAKQIRPGVSSGDKNAEALYERLGFTRCGASFFMEA